MLLQNIFNRLSCWRESVFHREFNVQNLTFLSTSPKHSVFPPPPFLWKFTTSFLCYHSFGLARFSIFDKKLINLYFLLLNNYKLSKHLGISAYSNLWNHLSRWALSPLAIRQWNVINMPPTPPSNNKFQFMRTEKLSKKQTNKYHLHFEINIWAFIAWYFFYLEEGHNNFVQRQ